MRQFLLSILVAFVLLLGSMTSNFAQSAKTTYDFSTDASLTFTGVWFNQADITIAGTAFRISNGINGDYSNETTGGASNSKCLMKEGSGGESFILQRVDGQPFQFYGIWVKHESMNSYYQFYSLPPWYTLTASTFSYQDNTARLSTTGFTTSTQTISPGADGITTTSVQISFQAISYFWIDDIIVGPVPASPPTTTTNAASSVTSTGATLNGSINANNASTTVTFEYGLTTSYGSTVTADQSPVTGSSATSVSKAITGLTAGTTYHYRVKGVNAGGTTNGSDQTFTTLSTSLSGSTGGTSIAQNTPVYIASSAIVTGATLNGAIVSISGNFASSQDILGIDGTQSGTTSSISYTYDSSKGILMLTGVADVATYQTILRKVTYTNTSATPSTNLRSITISLNKALPYSANGHYYEFVPSSGIKWTDAKTAAEGLNYFGLKGYLATITDKDENDFCTAKLSGDGWMGATDADAEGTWKWVTGPEAGQTFSYTNWNSGQPDNYNGIEDYAQFYVTGKWNDLPDSEPSIVGYVVEYGGSAGDPTLDISDVVTVDFAVPVSTAASSIQSNSFQANWNTVSGATNYYLDVATNSSFSSILSGYSNKNVGNVTTYKVEGLNPVTTYYYRVRATALATGYNSNISSATTIKADQTITFNAIPTKTYRDIDFNPATASSGLTVSYTSSDSNVATVVNDQIHIVGPGSCTIYADQAGNASYNAATQVSQTLTVSPNNALEFDGSNDYVQLPANSLFDFPGNSVFTFESWIYYTGAGNSCLFSKGGFFGQAEYSLFINSSSNKLFFMVAMQSVAWQNVVTSVSEIPTNKWVHIALVKTSTDATIYLNGIPDASGNLNSTSQSASAATAHGIVLGGKNFASSFYGKMDEVHFWNEARTAAQIHDHMCKSLVGNESNLIASYDFDQSSGTVLPDRSSNSINGILTNMDESTDWVSSTAFNTWKGLSTDWNSASNWSLLTSPVSSDNLGIYQGVANYPEISDSPTINLLVLGSTSSLTLSSNLTITNNLILESNLNLNGNNILLETTGTLVEGNGLLWGYPGAISATRTLGLSSTNNLGGLGAVITTGSAAPGSTTIVRRHNAQSGVITSIKRNYTITPTTNTGLNATLTFKYSDSELNGLNESNLKLFKSTDAGTNWSNQRGTLNVSANSLTLSGIDGFSLWTVAEKQTQTITFNALPSKTYGDSDFTPVATATSGLTVSFTTSDSNVATIIGGQIHIVGTGTCTIYGDQDGNADYLPASQVSQTFTVSQATLTVTADNKTKVYGDDNPTLTFQYSGWKNDDDDSDLDIKPTASTTVTNTTSVGTYTNVITVSGGADNNYAFSYVPADFSITAATLTVTADAKTKVYGDANPTLTFQYSGWKNDDDDSDLDIKPVASTTVTNTTSVGTYTDVITVSGGVDNNYAFSYVPSDFKVTAATLTVTADAKTKVYGDDNPTLTFQYSGWKNIDDDSDLDTKPTVSTTVTNTTSVGTYTDVITVSGGADNNYAFSYVPADFEVTAATLTVTADAKTKVYGDVNPALTFKYSGWKNSDDESDLDTKPTASTTVTNTTSVGTYTEVITVSGGADNNYAFSYVPADFEITKAMLTVTADSQSKAFGAPNPSLTFQYSGWKNGETESVLNTKPTASTIIADTTPVGTYENAITVSGGSDNNYDFTYVSASFTVNKGKLVIWLDQKTKNYGDENPTLTYRYTGFMNGDDESDLDYIPYPSTSVTRYTNAGTYISSITMTGGLDDNYYIVNVPANFIVNKAPLTVKADNKTKAYGENNPDLTVTYSGWKNGESEAVLDVKPVVSTTVNATTLPGVYPNTITAQAGSDNNYKFEYVAGTFTVTQASQSIVFNALAPKTYGDAPFILSATSNSGLTISYTCTNSDVAIVSGNTVNIIGAGTAVITASQSGDSNYLPAATVSQTFTVNRKPLFVAGITAASKIYDGNANAVLAGGTLSGTINSDVITLNNATSGTFSQTSVGTEIPVSTAMTISGDKVANYVLSLPNLKADITPKVIAVTAKNASRICDQPEQALSYSFEPSLVGTDTFTGTLTRTVGNTPGVYPILQGTLSLGTNYSINFTGASYTITNTKNLAPTVDQPSNLTVLKNSKEVTVTLTGIDPVSNCMAQDIESIVATADNKNLIPEIVVDYTKGQPTAKLKLKIADGLNGETTIHVKLKDNGGTENSGTDTREISFNIKVEIPVGVEDLTQNFDVRVYPNPSKGLIKIETSGFNRPSVRIFKVTGEEIMKKMNLMDPIETMDLGGNAPGIYFVEISDQTNTITKKLILKN